MLDVKANKKMVQQYLTEKTGKVVLLKDVHNMQASEVRQKIKPQEELQQLCSWLDSARIQPSKDSYSVNHRLKPSLKKSALVFWKTQLTCQHLEDILMVMPGYVCSKF